MQILRRLRKGELTESVENTSSNKPLFKRNKNNLSLIRDTLKIRAIK